jgi:prepilin-type N-terminal cleavage/methylation domain-containing protein
MTMQWCHRIWRDRRGFGLAELMVSTAVLAVVGAAVGSVLIGTLHSFQSQSRMIDAQTDLAAAMALVQDDLRHAGYVTDNMNQNIFQQLTTGPSTDRVQFVGDVNADGVSERITYAVDSNANLTRTQDVWTSTTMTWTAGTAYPVAASVSAFTLKFNLVDPCTATISQQTATQVLSSQTTTFIAVSLSNTATYNGQTTARTLSSEVAAREGDVRPICS